TARLGHSGSWQIAGSNGEIIDVKTGKVLVPAPARSRSGSRDDGLGEGEDRLELVEDQPLPCPACRGGGRQRTGFGDRTEPCDNCGGSRRVHQYAPDLGSRLGLPT